MAVVGHCVLGKDLGLQQVDPAVTIQHNCCAKSAMLSSSIVVRLRTKKMMNKTVTMKNKLKRISKKTGYVSQVEGTEFSTVRSKATLCVMARLLYQMQEDYMNAPDFKQQQQVNYTFTAYMQILGNKAISYSNKISAYRQQVDFIMAVCVEPCTLDQLAFFKQKTCDVNMPIKLLGKLWLTFDSGKLGLVQDRTMASWRSWRSLGRRMRP